VTVLFFLGRSVFSIIDPQTAKLKGGRCGRNKIGVVSDIGLYSIAVI
jgi:hypothetical protein